MYIMWVYGQCPAKVAKGKICHEIGLYPSMCRTKSKFTKNNTYRLNNQSAIFTGTKNKTTNVYLVTDEGGALQTMDFQTAIDEFKTKQWFISTDVYLNNTTSHTPMEF